MDTLTFVAEMTKALAWPVAIATVLIRYRRTLLDLAARITAFKYGSIEATFEKQRAQTAEITPPAPMSSATFISPEIELLARKDPKMAIYSAWEVVEAQLKRLLSVVDPTWKGKTPIETLQFLNSAGILTNKEMQSLSGLMMLRNLSAHSPGNEISSQKALEFITLANAVAYFLSLKTGKP